MPTSAIGGKLQRRRSGFTLIELMVVLAVIGLAASLVLLTAPPLGGGVRTDAERLAARSKLAQDEAYVLGRPLALVLDRTGYSFERRTGFTWRAVQEPPFDRRTWSDGVQPDLVGAGAVVRVVFDPVGGGEPSAIVLRQARESFVVHFDGSGVRVEPAGVS